MSRSIANVREQINLPSTYKLAHRIDASFHSGIKGRVMNRTLFGFQPTTAGQSPAFAILFDNGLARELTEAEFKKRTAKALGIQS